MAILAARMDILTGPAGDPAGLPPAGSESQSAADSPILDVIDRGGAPVWRCSIGGRVVAEGPNAPAVCAELSDRQ